jgi:flagellar motility protein MotE (MotC chaperone)
VKSPFNLRRKGGTLRPSLFMLTAVAAGASALAQTVNLGKEEPKARAASAAENRLGVAIEQDMAERDKAYARRAQAIDLREKSVKAAEQRLQSNLADQPAGGTRAAASSSSAVDDGRPVPQPIEELARIYQAMKPARAAAIFSALDPDVQTQIARQMRNRSVALLMANMEPVAAARLSMRLAGRSAAVMPAPIAAPPTPLALATPQRRAPSDPRAVAAAGPAPRVPALRSVPARPVAPAAAPVTNPAPAAVVATPDSASAAKR